MYGIIDDNKKFILLDSDHDKLRTTALMLAKEIDVIVPEYDEEGEQTGEHTEKRFIPMFDEDTVDEAIKEYADEDIETAYNGDKYLKGNAPAPSKEYQSAQRDQYINDIEWRVSRYRDQVEIGVTPTDDKATYTKILQYMQYLRDYPESSAAWYEQNPLTFDEWCNQ